MFFSVFIVMMAYMLQKTFMVDKRQKKKDIIGGIQPKYVVDV